MTETGPRSLRRLMRASAISGIGSAVSISSGIIKTKAIALLLGPGGVGLFGLFQSILSTAGTVSGMGLGVSGVRQVAAARADADTSRLAIVRVALLRSSIVLGSVGALLVILLRGPISEISVGSPLFSRDIIWIGLAVWCTVISGAQSGILSGMLHIGDLTRSSSISSVVSLPFTILLVWLFRDHGIAVAVALGAFAALAASWWYSSRLDIPRTEVDWRTLASPLRGLFGLGVVLMAAAVIASGSQYLVRVILARNLDLAAAGQFQAAWSVSMFYLGFVLNAMATDYYPRLSALRGDRAASNALINEQLQVALTLTGPVILGMLMFTPQVVRLLFTGAFGDTIDLLRLQLLGDLLKVASWPLAFLLLARQHGKTYFAIETLWNGVYLAIVWFGLPFWGIRAAGVAFVVAYAFYFAAVLSLSRSINGFRFSAVSLRVLLLDTACVTAIFVLRQHQGSAAFGVALFLLVAASYASFSLLASTVGGFPWRRIMNRS